MTGRLNSEIDALITASGARMVDIETRTQGKKLHLEVFVDTEEGITADQLAQLSRTLGKQLDEKDFIEDSYTLVVSSPGLDRPLHYPWQYRRHTGRTIQVTFRSGDERRELEGRVHEVTDEQIVVTEGEGLRAIPFEDIDRAMIIATL